MNRGSSVPYNCANVGASCSDGKCVRAAAPSAPAPTQTQMFYTTPSFNLNTT